MLVFRPPRSTPKSIESNEISQIEFWVFVKHSFLKSGDTPAQFQSRSHWYFFNKLPTSLNNHDTYATVTNFLRPVFRTSEIWVLKNGVHCLDLDDSFPMSFLFPKCSKFRSLRLEATNKLNALDVNIGYRRGQRFFLISFHLLRRSNPQVTSWLLRAPWAIPAHPFSMWPPGTGLKARRCGVY